MSCSGSWVRFMRRASLFRLMRRVRLEVLLEVQRMPNPVDYSYSAPGRIW